MTTLGNYNHDFPRLAKQSGFFFQLYRGRVNWTEIENLNIDDIIEQRNFELLEQNLLNVVNCNLEREYDLKILDQNFVKLFKLAQLGVDYLSYCEIYLDRCVVLLQEQLISAQEEIKTLKAENEKRTEELKKSKKRSKTQNYQCEKCEKAFISEVYLKFHDKRRHSNPSTPKSLENTSINRLIDTGQQTEDKKTQTASTQTIDFELELKPTHVPKNEDVNNKKEENNEKIENLEKELKDLKARLKRAENSLTEVPNSSLPPSINFPGPLFYPPMMPFVPPYYTQPTCYHDVGYQTAMPEHRPTVHSTPEVVTEEPVCVSSTAQTQEHITYKPFNQKHFENDIKENFDPKMSPVKPLPLPRKKKQNIEVQTVAKQSPVVSSIQSETNLVQSVPRTSTPIKEKPVEVPQPEPNVEPIEVILNESFSNEMVTVKPKHKSFFKKIVSKNSPKLRELSHNLKRSFTNLYDSVTPKEVKTNETSVDGLNNQLRELGVDPEWAGIPKKTMKQKLKALKHRRKLLTKENPSYPIIRKNIEKKVFQKLHIGSKRNSNSNKVNEQESIETQESSQPQDTAKVVSNLTKPIMYNIETESETELSGLETAENENPPLEVPIQKTAFVGMSSEESEPEVVGTIQKEFDFSVFQVNKESIKSVVEKKAEVLVEDLQTDSDFDDDFLEEYIEKRNKEVESVAEKDKTESILKSAQLKPQMNAKKKVLFVDDVSEGDVEDKKKDEDVWSIQSDWESDVR